MKGDRGTQFFALREESIAWLLMFMRQRHLSLAACRGGATKGVRLEQIDASTCTVADLAQYDVLIGYREKIPDLLADIFPKARQYIELAIGTERRNLSESMVFSRDDQPGTDFHGIHAFFRRRLLRGAWCTGDGLREYYRSKLYSEGVRAYVHSGGVVRQLDGAGVFLSVDPPPVEQHGRVIEELRDGMWMRKES